jgi:hypothetical protein
MSGIVADRLFDPYRYGHYLDITLDFKCKYSIRLYWFLSLYWSRGFTRFDFSWTALRTTLGIDQNPEGGKNIIQEIADQHTVRINAPDEQHIITGVYPKLSLFTKRVLEPIREDSLRMAPKPSGGTDTQPPRVEYNLGYEVTKRTDTSRNTRVEVADRIIITLNVSSLGRQIQEGCDINAQQRRIINKMTDQLFLLQDKALYFTHTAAGQLQQLEDKTDHLISGIANRSPQWSVCQTLDKLDATRDADLQTATTDSRRENIEKQHTAATRSAIQGFAMKSFSNFCEKELFTPAEEVTNNPSNQNTPTAPTTWSIESETSTPPDPRWQQFIDHVLSECSTDRDREILASFFKEAVKHVEMTDILISITVPNNSSRQWFLSKYKQTIANVLGKYYPNAEVKFKAS